MKAGPDSGYAVQITNGDNQSYQIPAKSPPLTYSVFTGWMPFLSPNQKSQYNIDQRQYNPVSRAQVTGRAEFTSEQLRMREINTTSGAEFTDVLKFECFFTDGAA